MKIKSGIIGIITLALLASCSTSNDVVSGRGIQKRKYNDGYYISLGKKYHNNKKSDSQNETVLENEVEYTASVPSPKSPLKTPEVNLNESTENEIQVPQPVYTAESDFESTEATTLESKPTHATKNKTKPSTKIEPGRTYSPKHIQTIVADRSAAASGGVMLVLLVILAIILPPLAVGIFEGITTRFWIDFILWILGWGVGWWLLGGLGGLCTLIAIIYAILIVLSII
jgi:uncharacterized membrane protein YqaE (UPF0057 family)